MLSTGYVYKIKCNISQKIYIGSTVKHPADRLRQHLRNYNNKKKQTSSSKCFKNNDFTLSIIDEIQFDHVSELRALEGQYIKRSIMDPTVKCVNRKCESIAGDLEWKGYLSAEKSRKYRNDSEYRMNIVSALQKKKICYCGASVSMRNFSRHRNSKKHRQYDIIITQAEQEMFNIEY